MMIGDVLILIGSVSLILWGIVHLIPTRNVVSDFGEVSRDNRRIITMEWINEGAALIFIGILVTVPVIIGSSGHLSVWVHILSAVMLMAMAMISLFTGFKVRFLPFRLCPIIFSASAALIIIGTLL